jgi:hypothetical protein
MSLTAQYEMAFKARLVTAGDLGDRVSNINLSGQVLFANGTGAGQAQNIFADERSLTVSGGTPQTENLDLAASLTDPNGDALTFATMKGVIVKAAAANPGALIFGGAASNAFLGVGDKDGDADDVEYVYPGECKPLFLFPGAGLTVTASTGDILKVTTEAANGTYIYDIVAIGT